MELIPVENSKDLFRDTFTGAIINNNNTEYDNYISNYDRLKKEREELSNLKKEVSSLTSSVDEIKNMIKLLVKEKNDVAWKIYTWRIDDWV